MTSSELGDYILELYDELEDVNPGAALNFGELYPQLSLSGSEWLDFCSQKSARILVNELLDELAELEI